MIGRGAYGKPWLLGQVMADLGRRRAQARPVDGRAACDSSSSNMTPCSRSTARRPASISRASISAGTPRACTGSAEFRNKVNTAGRPGGRRRDAARILRALAGAGRRLTPIAQAQLCFLCNASMLGPAPHGRASRRIRPDQDRLKLAGSRANGRAGAFYRWATIGSAVILARDPGRSASRLLSRDARARHLAVAAADRAAADRQSHPGDRADGAAVARWRWRAAEQGAWQRAAAHAAGGLVLGHRRGADRDGRDFRLAAVPVRPRILVLRPRARACSKIPSQLAQSTYSHEVKRVGDEARPWQATSPAICGNVPIDESAGFAECLAYQTYSRSLNEAAISNDRSRWPDAPSRAWSIHYDGLINPSRGCVRRCPSFAVRPSAASRCEPGPNRGR